MGRTPAVDEVVGAANSSGFRSGMDQLSKRAGPFLVARAAERGAVFGQAESLRHDLALVAPIGFDHDAHDQLPHD